MPKTSQGEVSHCYQSQSKSCFELSTSQILQKPIGATVQGTEDHNTTVLKFHQLGPLSPRKVSTRIWDRQSFVHCAEALQYYSKCSDHGCLENLGFAADAAPEFPTAPLLQKKQILGPGSRCSRWRSIQHIQP